MSDDPRRAMALWAALGGALALTVGLGTATTQQLRNTLHRGGDWRSDKIGLERSVMGSAATMVTRTATAGDRVNLGSWFGHQTLLHERRIDVESLEVDLELTPASEASVVLGAGPAGRTGVRLSLQPLLPCAVWRAAPDGRFLDYAPFACPTVHEGRNHLRLTNLGDHLHVEIDGVHAAEATVRLDRPGGFGFVGGDFDVFVDNLRVVDVDGRVLRDDFTLRRGRVAVAATWLFALGLPTWALLRAGRTRGGRPALPPGQEGSKPPSRQRSLPPQFPAILCLLVLAACLALVRAVDARSSWPLYPDEVSIDYGPYPDSSLNADDIEAELRARFPIPKPEGTLRLLFLGTSQTRGAGASTVAKTWVERACAGLPREVGAVECLNTGYPGSSSGPLRALYMERWLAFAPDFLVVNLGNNDGDPGALAANVRDLVAMNVPRGIETLLVLEPSSPPRDPELNAPKHAALRAVAQELGLAPPIEMHAELAGRLQDGLLWWDFIHLRSFGQELFADRLLVDLAPRVAALRARAAQPSAQNR